MAQELEANVRVARVCVVGSCVWGLFSLPLSRVLVPPGPTLLPSSASQIYYHGEPISVNVHVTNNTNKTVKKIKISGIQGRGPTQGAGKRDSSQGLGVAEGSPLVNSLVENYQPEGKPRASSKPKGKAFEASNAGCSLAR